MSERIMMSSTRSAGSATLTVAMQRTLPARASTQLARRASAGRAGSQIQNRPIATRWRRVPCRRARACRQLASERRDKASKPGCCKAKAHKPTHLGYGGRRVLVSRKWTAKDLADHRYDRKAHVLAILGRNPDGTPIDSNETT